MSPISTELETLSGLLKHSAETSKVAASIKKLRQLVQSQNGAPALKELDHELETWLSKIDVILKEPVGRAGMSRHALHWVERLKNVG